MYRGTHVEITCTHVEIRGQFWGVSSLPPYWLQISNQLIKFLYPLSHLICPHMSLS